MNIEIVVIGVLLLLLIMLLIYQLARIQNTLRQIFEIEARKLQRVAKKDLFDMGILLAETFELNKPLHALINKITKRIDKDEDN